MLAQTILRRILLTAGYDLLSTTTPGALGTAFAAGGNGGFAVTGSRDGSPAGIVSPGCGVVALLSDRS